MVRFHQGQAVGTLPMVQFQQFSGKSVVDMDFNVWKILELQNNQSFSWRFEFLVSKKIKKPFIFPWKVILTSAVKCLLNCCWVVFQPNMLVIDVEKFVSAPADSGKQSLLLIIVVVNICINYHHHSCITIVKVYNTSIFQRTGFPLMRSLL